MISRKSRKVIYNALIISFLLGMFGYVCSRFIHLGDVEYTDNAQVKQHIVPINTRIQGFIQRICFDEFQEVKKGDTLVIIEDTELRLRLAQAEADLANALAGREASTVGIATTTNNLSVSDAGIREAQVQLDNAERELTRYERLLKEDAVTRQQYDLVKTAYESAKARYEQVSRAKQSTTLVKNEQIHRLLQNEAAIKLAQAAVELARLNLSYTAIVATSDGITGRKDIQEGQLVQPGQTLVDLVNMEDMWVIANFRETQLTNIKEGAVVEIKADAVPNTTYKGKVVTISRATGASYSLVPQDNATGNFVKVEQRVPVRISLKGNSAEELKYLRAGLNVECEVEY
ncbi:HlyD family secretion protein [Phocaeicola paurosaccharolyticus]|jgi:membrane fusion protein, multidrug efflux system|uniref:HlyD family secretion protein n=1 Tax=Phocaeicola paurosaccharolyticus TaxID=732242 RepID=UPI0004690888|nr:HlyD family secretion protein [Phocaeicola paurosaccharolyticus]